MQSRPTTFWGKLERDEAGLVVAWHPLEAHCADVSACAEALLQHTLLRRRLAALGGRDDLSAVDVARLSALAALHDIGKFNRGFQRKGDAEPRDTAGHVAEVLRVIGSGYEAEQRLYQALELSTLEAWAEEGAALELLVAAIGHHGRPVGCGNDSGLTSFDPSVWLAHAGLDPMAGIAALVHSVRRWFPLAFVPDARSFLPGTAAFQHAFAGLVMLADWLGSDRHDELFPFATSLEDRMSFARERARCAVERIGLATAPARAALGTARPGFGAVSAFAPRDAQERTLGLPEDAEGSLTVLESETGSGKTEAALVRFVRLFHAGLVDGMTFALPTRTAATQLHTRVVEAVARAFADPVTRPPVVLAVPGYVQVDDVAGRRLPAFEVLWNDDDKARMRFRGWAAEQPKRFLAGAVVVGTIDQVLLSSLRVGHAHLRATALLRHLLVVDEVHASDAYMTRVLEEVLRFHVQAGGHAFLMSATLGSAVRARLMQAALGRVDAGANIPSLASALASPYPVVHHATPCTVSTTIRVEAPGLAKAVGVEVAAWGDHPDRVAAEALARARGGARVLVLRNTVNDALATQHALETLLTASDAPLLFTVAGLHTLHHARFSRDDRTRLDRAIESRLGKAAPQRGGFLAIATQTVQQSLDLDADVMLTDLAPMDVLLQRFGRVHRHRERDAHRPEGFRVAHAIVLVGDEPLDRLLTTKADPRGPHGAGTVYDDLTILEATRRELEPRSTLLIPEQNRELVERTTHPEALSALAESLAGAWPGHLNRVRGRTFSKEGLADMNLVDREAFFGQYAFNDLGNERISTRLGEGDRRVLFEPAPRGPFGGVVRELVLPAWLARDVPTDPDARPTDVVEGSDGSGRRVTFHFGPKQFFYDRLGIQNEKLKR